MTIELRLLIGLYVLLVPVAAWWTWYLSRKADAPLRDAVDLMRQLNATTCDAVDRMEQRSAEVQLQVIRAIGDMAARPATRSRRVHVSVDQPSDNGRSERMRIEREGLEPVGREDVPN